MTGHVRVHVAGMNAIHHDVIAPEIRVKRPLLRERQRADAHFGYDVRGRRPTVLFVIAGSGCVHELPHQRVQLLDGQQRRGQLFLQPAAGYAGQVAARAGHVHHAGAGPEQREQRVAHRSQREVVDAQRLGRLHRERFRGGHFVRDGRVVHQHVDARRMVSLDERLERRHARSVRHVQLVELRQQPQRVQASHRRLAAADVPGRQVHVTVELLAQRLHHRVPNAFVAAGHYRQFVGGAHTYSYRWPPHRRTRIENYNETSRTRTLNELSVGACYLLSQHALLTRSFQSARII